jgi:hypothetical protein
MGGGSAEEEGKKGREKKKERREWKELPCRIPSKEAKPNNKGICKAY